MSIVWRLIHSSHAKHYPGSSEHVLFYDVPVDDSALAGVENAHLWAAHEAPLSEIPALIRRLPNLKQLAIGPGAIAAEAFTALARGTSSSQPARPVPAPAGLSAIPDRKGNLLDSALQLPLTELNLWNVPFDESLFARLSALQDLTLVGCGNIGLGPGADELRARLPHAHIAATQ